MMRRLYLLTGLVALWTAVSTGCAKVENNPYADFEAAAKVVEHMIRPGNLDDTLFKNLYPEQRPSDFVEFLFTAYAAALWPPSKLEDKEVMKAYKGPMLPESTSISGGQTNDFLDKQLLLYANDEKGLLIGVGYNTPAEQTDFIRQWKFPADK